MNIAEYERLRFERRDHGVLHTCKAVLPIMAGQGRGAVVNLGSDAGRVGSSGEAVYSAAKGGIIAFTKSLAREMARHQVRVNCVCPGPTDTALFASFAGPELREALTRAIPFRRLGQPTDVANAVAFLASDEASRRGRAPPPGHRWQDRPAHRWPAADLRRSRW